MTRRGRSAPTTTSAVCGRWVSTATMTGATRESPRGQETKFRTATSSGTSFGPRAERDASQAPQRLQPLSQILVDEPVARDEVAAEEVVVAAAHVGDAAPGREDERGAGGDVPRV